MILRTLSLAVPGGDMVAVSDDGTVVAGKYFDANLGATVAGRWTEATGWESLDPMPVAACGSSYPSACDISGDGSGHGNSSGPRAGWTLDACVGYVLSCIRRLHPRRRLVEHVSIRPDRGCDPAPLE